jgi:hypothetical protein
MARPRMPVASTQKVAGPILTATAPLEECVAVAEAVPVPVPAPVLRATLEVGVANAVGP